MRLVARPAPPQPPERGRTVEKNPPGHVRPSDLRIRELAAGQHGVVTARQLRHLGLGARGVRHRAAAGRLDRLHRGIYAVERPRRESHWMAAVLACGPGAALSHRSAAALWGLHRDRDAIDVTVPQGQRRVRPGLVAHRSTLPAADVTAHQGIPCTTLARTLVDLAGVVDRGQLVRAVDLAEELRLFDLRAIRAQLDAMRGRRGAGRLAALLAAYDGPDRTRSPAERVLLHLIAAADIPTPEVNAWIPLPEGGGYEPDLLWRDQRLIVEVDGRTHHARRAAFEHDRQRDRRLARLGFETRRYAAREVTTAPGQVVAELAFFLKTNVTSRSK
jgi:very-short-patch-repair endonuclease